MVYVSANGAPTSARDVAPVEDTSTQTEGLVLPSSAVYVEEDAPVTAQDLEKTYLYIIYEF